MTPCEKRGYEVGQVFEVVDDRYVVTRPGAIMVLHDDDGSSCPTFLAIANLPENYKNSLQKKFCVNINDVKRIYPPEEESETVDVMCEGKTTQISRESAKALNLL